MVFMPLQETMNLSEEAARTIPYIESKGIRVLKDEVVTLKGGIQLIGRIDRDSFRFYGKERSAAGFTYGKG